jgi:DNA-binding transcriptional regulator YdaS (Cro superfamily)
MKRAERENAERLRREDGMSIKAIAARLAVSPSSVSRWVAHVELTAEQRRSLAAAVRLGPGRLKGAATRREAALESRRAAQEHGRALARRGHPLHQRGCMLYWAEGSKLRNVAALTNSDPDLLGVFVAFLSKCYGVPRDALALSVNCHLGNGLSLDRIERWWLQRLDLPEAALRAATVNRPSGASRHRRGNVLPYGTARVCLYSTVVVQSIYGAIQQYAGIDRPEWIE